MKISLNDRESERCLLKTKQKKENEHEFSFLPRRLNVFKKQT